MPVSSYVPHLLYTTALISISVHLLFHRKAAADQRAQLQARTSILESLAQRLRSGEDIPDVEVDRLMRLGRDDINVSKVEKDVLAEKKDVGWREVFFGRKTETDPGNLNKD